MRVRVTRAAAVTSAAGVFVGPWCRPRPASASGARAGGGDGRAARCSRGVSPPCSQKTMWWTSQCSGNRPQPGATQVRSRATTARRSAGGMVRVARPTSTTCDSTVHHDPRDGRVAPDQLRLGRRHRTDPGELPGCDVADDLRGVATSGGVVDDHRQVRPHPADAGRVDALQPVGADVGEGVGTSLRGCADIGYTVGRVAGGGVAVAVVCGAVADPWCSAPSAAVHRSPDRASR